MRRKLLMSVEVLNMKVVRNLSGNPPVSGFGATTATILVFALSARYPTC
jgi:hypothetical protein